MGLCLSLVALLVLFVGSIAHLQFDTARRHRDIRKICHGNQDTRCHNCLWLDYDP